MIFASEWYLPPAKAGREIDKYNNSIYKEIYSQPLTGAKPDLYDPPFSVS